jgi:dihydrofolate reductase
MTVSIVVCVDSCNGIGLKNTIPWKSKKDFAFFKKLTLGSVMVMGRKTFESIGKPLPGRVNVILSNNSEFVAPVGTVVFNDLQSALNAYTSQSKEIFIIGGSSVYSSAFPFVETVYKTVINKDFKCDTFFPEIPDSFKLSNEETVIDNDLQLNFQIFTAVKNVKL